MTDTTPTETKPLLPGHPAGCVCVECEDAGREEEHARYIRHLLMMLDEGITDARRGVFAAIGNLQELTGPAYDIELAEGPDGPDALADLEAADKLLRNAGRIVRVRQQLLKEGH